MASKFSGVQFSAIGWAMAEFHKGERRQVARARRDNARRRQEGRQGARECKRMVREGALLR